MGNPHAVVEVDDVARAEVAGIGPALQASGMFPDSANIGFAQVVDPGRIRLRVYERGVGETLACGSGACAAVAVLVRAGRLDRDVVVSLPGGDLRIAWPDDAAQVSMSGPTAFVFEGRWTR
jgi:diaminopimelate epimerase